MKVKNFIKQLEELEQNNNINLACDEEWNIIFKDIQIQQNGINGGYVMFGTEGDEQ